jgi:hypothetical protein
MIVDFLKAYKCNPEHKKFKKFLIERVPCYHEVDLFITSFSERGNYLEQWRAYTPDGGISIGFCSQELENGFYHEKIPEGNEIRDGVIKFQNEYGTGGKFIREKSKHYKCKYFSNEALVSKETDERKEAIETKEFVAQSIISWFKQDSLVDTYKRMCNKDAPPIRLFNQLFYAMLNKSAFRLLSTIKHSVYRGEEEWRWVKPLAPENKEFCKYLNEKNKVYIKAGIKPEKFIKEVWISPHGDKKTIRRVLEFYKERDNLSFKIHESKIPYRL